MAGASAKKQVQNNTKLLQFIELLTGISYAIFSVSVFYFKRPSSSKPLIIFSIPVAISLFVIEKTGRPKYDSSGRVISSGQDLTQEGLVEYLFDIIYATVIIATLSVLFGTNKIWWLYLVIPIFAGYKVYGVVNAGRKMLGYGGNKEKKETKEEEAAASSQSQKSKRQQKLEARGDKPKVRYR